MGAPPSLALTAEVERLVLTSPDQRDRAWRQAFFAAVGGAAVVVDEPAVADGPDGFGYTQLRLPPPAGAATVHSLDGLLEWSADRGVGAVLRDRAGDVLWVFTFGNLWARLSSGSFDPSPADDDHRTSTVGPDGEQALMGAPSDGLLPPVARRVLRDALTAMGVADPQVAAVQRTSGHPTWSLALTLPGGDAAAHRVTWYLPPQMGLVGIHVVAADLRQPL